MINKLRTFAIAMMVTGATVTTASATTTTNTQVLDNISLNLKMYQQGALNSTDKALAATPTTFNTSDLIQQLAPFAGFTFAKNQKLVYSTIFSNFAVSSGFSTVSTNSVVLGPGTNVYMEENSGTNQLTFDLSGTTTNVYVITNSNGKLWIQKVTYQGTNTPVTNASVQLTNNVLLTNGTGTAFAVASTNINPTQIAGAYTPLSSWSTVTTLGGTLGAGTNAVIVITDFTPTTKNLFTNAASTICVMTPKSGATAASLVDVHHWVGFSDASDFNGNSFAVYKEAGVGLSGGVFTGTNIASQTENDYASFFMFTAWPTNSAPVGQTNLIFGNPYLGQNDTPVAGFSTRMAKLINLTVNGKPAEKAEFQILGSQITPNGAGVGYIGGTLTTNTLQTNTFNGVTSTNITYGAFAGGFGNYVGTNFINTSTGLPIYIQGTKDAILEGNITVTFLSAGPEIVPAAP